MMNTYGNNIKVYRKEHKLKQEELADKLGISSNMLGKIERGERKPNKEVQDKFFNISGIKYEDEIINELNNKLEKYLLDYLSSQYISNEETIELMMFFRGFTDENKISEFLNNIMSTPPSKDKSIKYYAINIFLILDTFYRDNIKQCNMFYSKLEIFILDNMSLIMELLSKMESSIFINSRIPLYRNNLPVNTHSKANEYLSNITTSKYKFAWIVQDNSMSPKFEKGHTITVIEDEEYSNGDDVVVSINNATPIIRKIIFKDKFIILQTYNDTSKTDIYSKDKVKILGKIIEVRY